MNRIFREKKGFSLVELAIVLVIIGLITGAAVTLWRSTIDSTRLSSTKTNLDNIKNAVINFAMANGRLPCPDTILPPNNQGDANPAVPLNCNCTSTCAAPPCYVPFKTLQLQLPGGRDSFGNVFRYDVSHETTAGAGLTNTTQDTFCGVLFEYMSQSTVPPIPAPQLIPYVTNAAGQGYTVAAVIISETPINNVFNVQPPPPLPSLTGKNVVGADREYEMANRANDNTYGDLVAELTYGELYNKVCNSANTVLKVFPPTIAGASAQVPAGSGPCLRNGGSIPFAYLPLNGYINYYAPATDCTGSPTQIYYQTLSNTDWNGPVATRRNGQVNADNPPTDH